MADTPEEVRWDNRGRWWPDSSTELTIGGDSNLWMCGQDAGQQIGAWLDRTSLDPDDEGTTICLEECTPTLQSILENSLPYSSAYYGLQGRISDFVRLVAREIIIFGFIAFEIGVGWSGTGDEKKMYSAKLRYLRRDSLLHLPGYLVQAIPTSQRCSDDPRHIVLDRTRLVIFRPPRNWRIALSKMRHALRQIGEAERDWLEMFDARNQQDSSSLDTRSIAIARARATSKIGWTGRGQFSKYISEYHLASRELLWYKFCIHLRNEILTTLSSAFAVVGSLVGESPHLTVKEFPTVAMVRENERKLNAGTLRCVDALQPFLRF